MDFSFEEEFRSAAFGDSRLNKRAWTFANGALRHPECSIPKMAGSPGGAEGLYRFIANDRVTVDNISQPHGNHALERCEASGPVLVLHDSTTFGYGKDTKRLGLGEIAGGGVGFQTHVSLAVAEDSRRPLGVLKHTSHSRPPADKGAAGKAKKRNRKSQADADNESLRWAEHAIATGKLLGSVPHVHVADRESDDYKYLAMLHEADELFVTRVSTNRVLGKGEKLFTKMDDLTVFLCREVQLSRRGQAPSPKQRKTNPARDARMAKLEVSAGTLELPRTSRAPRTCAQSLQLNFVLVREIEMAHGEEPVTWRLVTNLPVSTAEEIARVVDIYRIRWMIEEFFKALKTGCSFNDHQLESYDALTKLLALLLPVAWKMLDIRTVARTEPEAPATLVLTARQIAFLRVLYAKQHPKLSLPTMPTVKQAVYALAALGGHFKQNGDPGWQTLGHGLQRLLQAEEDAMALFEQVQHMKLNTK